MTYSFIDESGETRLVGSISPAPGGGSQSVTVQLTNAQIKTLRASEVEVVDAPGVGKAISLLSVLAVLDQTHGAYDFGGGFAEIDLGFAGYWTTVATDGSGWFSVTPVTDTETRFASFIADLYGPGARVNTGASGASVLSVANLGLLENLPLCFGNLGTQEIDGGGTGNTLSALIRYEIVDTVPFT